VIVVMFAPGDSIVAILEHTAFLAKVEAFEERNGQNGYRVHFNGYDRSYNQWYSVDEENKELYPATPLYIELLRIHNGKSSPRPTTAQRVPIENPVETPVPKPIHTKNRLRIPRDGDGKPLVKKINNREPKFAVGEYIKATFNTTEYSAEVMAIEEHEGRMSYRVHYTGWNKRYDQWVPLEHDDLDDDEEDVAGTPRLVKMIKTINKFSVGEFIKATYNTEEYNAVVGSIEEHEGKMSYRVEFMGRNKPDNQWVPLEEEGHFDGASTSEASSKLVKMFKRKSK
ncbi:unnamed protein product, partial [Caenorhabditis brenneri]